MEMSASSKGGKLTLLKIKKIKAYSSLSIYFLSNFFIPRKASIVFLKIQRCSIGDGLFEKKIHLLRFFIFLFFFFLQVNQKFIKEEAKSHSIQVVYKAAKASKTKNQKRLTTP